MHKMVNEKQRLERPVVSVIIPHFNRSILLKETIASIQQQTFKDFEIVVVDDGSDESELAAIELLKQENIKIIKRQDGEKGPSTCRNLGANSARGKYLLFLDSDDLLAPICLEQRISVMDDNPQLDMAIFLMENFAKVPGDTKTYFNINAPFEKLPGLFLQNRNPWQTMAPIWQKDFFMKVGGFDESFLYMEDPDLHIRALAYPDANIKTFYEVPADCYYRINHIDDTKKTFWYNSIYYRILFYKKLTETNSTLLSTHSKDIRTGVHGLIRGFLYHRANEFPQLFQSLLQWMKASGIFSSFEIARIKYLTATGNSSSSLLKALHARGLCYRWLPAS